MYGVLAAAVQTGRPAGQTLFQRGGTTIINNFNSSPSVFSQISGFGGGFEGPQDCGCPECQDNKMMSKMFQMFAMIFAMIGGMMGSNS